MHIQSTKIRPVIRPQHSPSTTPGVLLAVPGQKAGSPATLYAFPPAKSNSEVDAAVLSFSKTASTMLAGQLHPHVGTAVRIGWLVVGAVKLLDDVGNKDLEWHEVMLKSSKLCLDSYVAASSASLVPSHLQLADDWSEGIGFLFDATQAAVDGEDMNTFQYGYMMDQSPPVELARSLLSIATAAESPERQFNGINLSTLPKQPFAVSENAA